VVNKILIPIYQRYIVALMFNFSHSSLLIVGPSHGSEDLIMA
jgi:hypothetical protein